MKLITIKHFIKQKIEMQSLKKIEKVQIMVRVLSSGDFFTFQINEQCNLMELRTIIKKQCKLSNFKFYGLNQKNRESKTKVKQIIEDGQVRIFESQISKKKKQVLYQKLQQQLQKIKLLKDKLENIQKLLNCPLTLYKFQNPVLASDGNTYQLQGIQKWKVKRNFSPITNQPFKHDYLIPNRFIKSIQEQFNPLREVILEVIKKKQDSTSQIISEIEQIDQTQFRYQLNPELNALKGHLKDKQCQYNNYNYANQNNESSKDQQIFIPKCLEKIDMMEKMINNDSEKINQIQSAMISQNCLPKNFMLDNQNYAMCASQSKNIISNQKVQQQNEGQMKNQNKYMIQESEEQNGQYEQYNLQSYQFTKENSYQSRDSEEMRIIKQGQQLQKFQKDKQQKDKKQQDEENINQSQEYIFKQVEQMTEEEKILNLSV